MSCHRGTLNCSVVEEHSRCRLDSEDLTLNQLLAQLDAVRTTCDWDRIVVSLAAETLQAYHTELVERRRDMAALQRLVEEWQGK